VGYVSFALKEDASKAMETIGTHDISLNGRNLRVQWAEKKPKEGEAKKVDTKVSQKRTPKQSVSVPKDPNAIRTIVIFELPESADQKTLWKYVRKCDGAESAEIRRAKRASHMLSSQLPGRVRRNFILRRLYS